MRKVLFSLIIPVLLIGCAKVKEIEAPQKQEELHEVIFHAGWDPETRTVLQEDGSVWWSPGDEISLFVGDGYNGGYKLTATNTEPAAKADFIGQIGEKPAESSYIAVFPYDDLNWIRESTVHVTIPSEQVAKEGSFEKDLFVSIAVSDNENLYFKNICSGIKFSVSTPGIKKIVISSRDNTPISGDVFYEMETGEFSATSSFVTVSAPTELGFEIGKYYYAVFCPFSDASGISIKYYTEDKVGSFTDHKPIEFKRGVFKRLFEKDNGLPFYAYHEKVAKPSTLLPENVDKTKITDISFIVNSYKTTDLSIPTYSDIPVYFELDGTAAKLYTGAEAYELVYADHLFYGWKSLQNLDLSNVETHGVTDMSYMFAACTSLKTITFGDFFTGEVERMEAMFADCWALESLDLRGFITNQVTNMNLMFAGCSSLKTLDISNFDTSNVEDMTFMFGIGLYNDRPIGDIFVGCSALKHLDLHTFNTSKVMYMNGMFKNCLSLESVDVSGWDTSLVVNMNSMFSGCASLESVDLSSFDTRSVEQMGFMFEGCARLKSLDLSGFNTSKVSNMEYMFAYCEELQSLDIRNFDASSLTDAGYFVGGAQQIKKLDLGSFDVSKIDRLDSPFRALAFKSKNVAVRCIDVTKQVIENQGLVPYEYIDLNHITWVGLDDTIPDLPDVVNPDLYYSVDFSMDKQVKVLQTATEGNGVDIVIMGDEYSDRLIADGTYESDMRETIDAIFSEEPMKSYKNLFNVYMVYAVSKNESCDNGYGSTALGVYMQGYSGGICKAYIKAASNKLFSDIATIVVCHDPNAIQDGRSYVITEYGYYSWEYYDYGQAQQCVAFLKKEDDAYANTVVHEFGHLFAKLADEYVEKDEAIGTSNEYEVQNLIDLCQHTGAYKNIDFTNDTESIKWSHFIGDSRYSNECIGAYEGGHLYSQGVWRPSEHSIMRESYADLGFNAPSREAIYYRIHKLAYGEDWQYGYETFVQQDLKNIPSEPQNLSSPKYIPSPARFKQKHLFKMKESMAPDGRKMITVIMD